MFVPFCEEEEQLVLAFVGSFLVAGVHGVQKPVQQVRER